MTTTRFARARLGRIVPLTLALTIAACDLTEAPPPPAAPTAFTVTVNSNQQVTLSWVLAGDDADEVRIERAPAGGVFAPLTTLPATPGASTQHVDASLTPATTYQYRIQACNDSGCSSFAGPTTSTTFATLVIVTTTLPGAIRGQPYSAGLNATGADSVYTWFVDAGSLPAGVSLSNSGIISGTPATEGIARFTARVRSGDGQTAVRDFTITVTAPPAQGSLGIRTVALPPALAGLLYQPTLGISGGDGTAVTFALASGTLPAGLTLNSAGGFSGRPTQIGSFPITVRATTASGLSTTRSYTLVVVAEDTGRFNITRVDVSPVSPAINQQIVAAIAKWERVLLGDLTRESIPRDFFQSGNFCPFADLTNGTFVDDVVILINIAPIDGEGKILGQASPCAIRDDILTIVGVLTLDADDLNSARFAGTQTVTDILFHEMGHILGSGTIWEGFDCPPDEGFTACWSYLTGAGTEDPRFTGPNAVREWQALGGTGDVPVENQGGEGTRDSHWRESAFRTEIMTGFVSPPGVPNPLSRVTIGSMADLGYAVNYGAADAFALPGPGASLRLPLEEGWEQVNLHPILMKLPDGSRRIIPR